jgi:DNA polymerase-3 subunit gamma/tau
MAYLVLARKYRPQVFDDMVGQDHLKKTLTNALASGRVAHAYLFCGPRGVGKTTAARILAKALNCVKGPTPVPCNVCGPCVEITEGRSLDVLEIDGASNRGINEVRELRENVRFAPTGGKSKVYIIDEVHMLTQEAFNALLKTLEEPPPHVVFIFATTEPFKVPATILSRTQRFDFARIPSRKIAEHLETILAREKIAAAPEALALIARRARGGLRDALSLLDQIIAASDGALDRASVERFLGLVGGDAPARLVDRIADGDAGGALRLLDQVYTEGADLRDLAEGVASHLRDLLLLSIGTDLTPLLEATESEVPALEAEARRLPRATLLELLEHASELGAAIRKSEFPRLTMELALAEMAEVTERLPVGEIARRLLELEARLGGGAAPPAGTSAPRGRAEPVPRAGAEPAARAPSREPESPATAREPAPGGKTKRSSPSAVLDPDLSPAPSGAGVAESAVAVEDDPAQRAWLACVAMATEKSRFLGSTLATAVCLGFTEDGALLVRPPTPRDLFDERLADAETRHLVQEALERAGVGGGKLAVEGSESARARASAASRDRAETPAIPAPADDRRTVGELFRDEPMLQKALDIFDGEVLP